MKTLQRPKSTYDVVIIGAGTAGLAARSQVSKKTDNYLVVDRGPLGTTCARVGCMPSKILIEAAHIFHQSTKFEKIGITGARGLKVSDAKLMRHVRSLRDRFVGGVLKDFESWQKTHLFLGEAVLTGPKTLAIDGHEVRAKRVILATGSKVVIPKDWQRLTDRILTNENIFELKHLPKRLGVIGAGAIGLELAQAMAQLGTKVFLFDERDSYAGISDPDVNGSIHEKIQNEMTLISSRADSIVEGPSCVNVRSGNKTYKVDQVLLAVGRRPNLDGLGLDRAGLELDENGLPEFDWTTGRVKDSILYMAGDMNISRPVLHEASDEGRIAGFNATRKKDHAFRRRTNLLITFTSPPAAVVGQSYAELSKSKTDFVAGQVNFAGQGRALTKLQNHGRLKVYAQKRTGKLLGAELFAPGGDHLAHLIAGAIEQGLDVFQLLSHPFYHPVLEEGLRTALRDLSRKVTKKPGDLDLLRSGDPAAGTMEKRKPR